VLVTFEGLDCVGKSSLIREVAAGLRATLPEHVLHLPDVSKSPTGRRLTEVYDGDELFGMPGADSTVISRCFAAAADLYYFDGALIAPMLAAGGIVLKERHLDTLIAHEAPVLTRRFGWTDQQAIEWLSSVLEPLQARPSLTILVEAPPDHQDRRLRERMQNSGRVLEPAEVRFNREVFRIRAEWYETLRLKDEPRWVSIANPDGEHAQSVARAIAAILDRRAAGLPAKPR
jgi:thymidylate kinase